MRRRRYQSPDGLDWRDPNMPVIRRYQMGDGSTKEEVDPTYEQRYREHLVSQSFESYRDDPTYYGRRRY